MNPLRPLLFPRKAGLAGRFWLAAFLSLLLVLCPSVLLPQWKNAPERTVLKNGLTLITQTDDASAATVLELLIGGGKRAEPPGLEGISYLTTRLAIEIPDQGKVRELMEKSTRYMMISKGDWSAIHIECLSENLDVTLRIVIKILTDPLFSGIRIDRNKDSMTNARKIERDDNINLGHLAQLDGFFRGAGYDGSMYGREESLKKIKGRDIRDFYDAHFIPANMILVAVSDLDSAGLREILQRQFAAFPLGKSTEAFRAPAPAAGDHDLELAFIEKETRQTLVSAGFLLPAVSERSYAVVALLENLLGRGPGSRLWTLRTDEKLAYNVGAQATVMRDGGILEAYLETDAAKQELAREALIRALREFYARGISAEELAETKALVRANFLRMNETKDRRAATLGSFEALGLGFDYFVKFPREVDAVALEEINAFVQENLSPEKSKLVTVGPKK